MLAWIAYAICALVWGSTYFGIALGITSFTPFGLVATRYLSAGVLAWGLGRLTQEPPVLRRDIPHLLYQGVLLLGLSNALVTWAEHTVPSGLTAVLCSTTPLFYALLGRETLRLRAWIGLIVGCTGVAVLTWKPGQGLALGGLGLLGLALAVFLWAYGTLHGRRHVQGRSLLRQAGVQMVAGGVFGALLAPWTGGVLHAPLTARALGAVVYLCLFGSLLAYTAFGYLARVWPPTKMSTYAFLNPIVAVVLGSLVLKEPFGVREAFGMSIILGGVALVQFPATAPKDPCPAEE